jgi:hypothetical protein
MTEGIPLALGWLMYGLLLAALLFLILRRSG